MGTQALFNLGIHFFLLCNENPLEYFRYVHHWRMSVVTQNIYIDYRCLCQLCWFFMSWQQLVMFMNIQLSAVISWEQSLLLSQDKQSLTSKQPPASQDWETLTCSLGVQLCLVGEALPTEMRCDKFAWLLLIAMIKMIINVLLRSNCRALFTS